MEDLLLESIQSVPWILLLQGAVVIVVGLYLKRYFDNIASYLMFRSNKDLGKNVRVILNGREGFITQVDWKFIYVTFHDTGNELIIPITKWMNQRWEVCKNGKRKEQ